MGDSNSVGLSFVLKKEGYKIAHIEAGMRSYDKRMLEEINTTLNTIIKNKNLEIWKASKFKKTLTMEETLNFVYSKIKKFVNFFYILVINYG